MHLSRLIPLTLLLACEGGDTDKAACTGSCADDSTPTDDSTPPDDSDAVDDSTATDDSNGTDDSTPPDDTNDPGTDLLDTACDAGNVVLYEHEDKTVEDLTDAMLAGTYTRLETPGRVIFCPGTWFARLLIRSDIDVIGAGDAPEDTVLSAGELGTILDIAGSGTLEEPVPIYVGVSNLTLDRGAGLDVDHNSGGGGLYCELFGDLTIDDVIFSNNFANDGPGMYTEDCTFVLNRTTFIDNEAEDDGGALTFWWSFATINDSVFTNNVGLDGGAIASFYSEATLNNVTIQDNTSAYYAGGMWLYNGLLDATDVTFSNNTNTGENGGGLQAYGTATLTNVTFENNTATRGGGIFVYYESEVTGTTCNFDGNTPEDIYVADYSEAGGVSMDVGMNYSFACAANTCTGT